MEIPGKCIFLNVLEEMFGNITDATDWDLSQAMLWGYFFTNSEPATLELVKDELVKNGYSFVDIFLTDKEDPADPDLFVLHVEKEETHTPESLDKRNDELYLIADKFGLDSYDGMDVGPIK